MAGDEEADPGDVDGMLEPIDLASSSSRNFLKYPGDKPLSPTGDAHSETQPRDKDTEPLLTLEHHLHAQASILAGRGSKEQAKTKSWNKSSRPFLWRNFRRWLAHPAMSLTKNLRKKLSKRLGNIANDPSVDADKREAAQYLLGKVEIMRIEMLDHLLSTVQKAIDVDIQRQASRLGEPPRTHRIVHSIIIDRSTMNPKDTSSEKYQIVLDEAYQGGWVMVCSKTLSRLGIGFTPLENVTVSFQGGMEGDIKYSAIGIADRFRFRIENVPNDGLTFESAPHPPIVDGLPEEGTVPVYVYKEAPRRASFIFGERAIAHLRLRQLPNFSTSTHVVQTIVASQNASAAEAEQDKAGKVEDERSKKKAEAEKEKRKREHDARKNQNTSAP